MLPAGGWALGFSLGTAAALALTGIVCRWTACSPWLLHW